LIAFAALAATNNNYQAPAFIAAGFSLLSILLTWFWFEETLPPEKRGQNSKKSRFSLGAMFEALHRPEVGFLLALMFAQQFAFGGFEQLLALFTLNRLGMNASSNAILFVFVGIIVVIVQGGMVGRWSRKFGDRWLVVVGLSILGLGMILTAITPPQPVPWYSQKALTEELSSEAHHPGETSPIQHIQIALPSDDNTGWVGLIWLLVALVPASIGGGILQPSINSLITKRVGSDEVGGILGISSAFLSGANAVAPLVLGAIFQLFGATAPFLIGGFILIMLWLITTRALDPEPD
jgi:DHA1 family tetracycline resistance protein-like MFS transporter